MKSLSGKSYEESKIIGNGTFGDVYTVIRDDGKEFAFKKFKQDKNDIELGVLREISILKMFQNNNHGVINMEDIIIEKDNIIGIIMKKYKYDLDDAINKVKLDKEDRKKITFQILKSILFLHENGIIHRDIKLENILLDENNDPVVADFTLAKVFDGVCAGGTHTNRIATVTYRAPEVVKKKKYGYPIDAWSLGILFYQLFTYKIIPFDYDKDTLEFISKEKLKFKNNSLGNMVRGLLIVDPKKRWTPRQCLESEFFNVKISIPKIRETISDYNISKIIKDLCEDFNVKKKVTKWAAQIFVNRTSCPVQSAVELACKFYETELYDIESEEYPEQELSILKKMEYNLFI